MSFERVKKNYDQRLWSKQMVRQAVKKGIITADDYLVITNEKYE